MTIVARYRRIDTHIYHPPLRTLAFFIILTFYFSFSLLDPYEIFVF